MAHRRHMGHVEEMLLRGSSSLPRCLWPVPGRVAAGDPASLQSSEARLCTCLKTPSPRFLLCSPRVPCFCSVPVLACERASSITGGGLGLQW